MRDYKYLIIGGGMTAAAAVEGIRSVDQSGSIGIISSENDPPYNRPPLSKALWKGDSLDSIWRKIDDKALTLHLGRTIQQIDAKKRSAVDSEKEEYSWGKLLLATGCSPRTLPFGSAEIIYYRTLADYRKLRSLSDQKKRFAVIGGGFIGSEIAAALRMNGKEVTLVFPGEGIGDRVFPRELSQFVTEYYQKKGVEVRAHTKPSGLEATAGGGFALKTATGTAIEADAIVAGIGVEPNVRVAQILGITTDNGIVVDEFLRTNQPDIYAAGDVASFPCKALHKRTRVEHEDNANSMGKQAGRNLAGKQEPYDHLPSFYSDLFDLGYEAVGDLDSRLETFVDWKTSFKEGVIYYLYENKVRGVLLWNVWGQVDSARRLIAESKPVTKDQLKGRLK